MAPKDWLKVEEVAELLKVQRVTVYNYIRQGKLKAEKISRDYIVTKEAIKAFQKAGYSKQGGRPKKSKEKRDSKK